MKKMTIQALIVSLVVAVALIGVSIAKDNNATEDKVDSVATKQFEVTHISQEELAEKRKDPNTVLIDIRTQKEVDDGFIPGAIHIPITGIMSNVSLLDEHLGKDLVFYCHSGVRAKRLTDYLQDIKHPSQDKLYHLKGDMRAWRANGNDVQMK